jgi:hypothetical protein
MGVGVKVGLGIKICAKDWEWPGNAVLVRPIMDAIAG